MHESHGNCSDFNGYGKAEANMRGFSCGIRKDCTYRGRTFIVRSKFGTTEPINIRTNCDSIHDHKRRSHNAIGNALRILLFVLPFGK